ncbi:MAG TPA: DNA methyltransferase [Rhodanobacteraceae bacterium]|nr:DNA methyltransferase [Rhodanobacteraceae bacterium]
MHLPRPQSEFLPELGLPQTLADQLIQAARDSASVSGLTHNFYRYPARFSPALVRAAIHAFTEPGDLVLDPFVGGGTTLVEALAGGRHGIGTDISALATFVSDVKTTIYTEPELRKLRRWADRVIQCIDMSVRADVHEMYGDSGYLRHLNGVKTWRLRNATAQALTSARRLKNVRLEKFARCAVLRTAQWALDGRKVLPSVSGFRIKLREHAEEMINGSEELARIADERKGAMIYCLQRATQGLELESVFQNGRKPRLVIMSPPYPGVHVLYHRWQIHGGKETPAPFWIANRLDGDGAAYYTMGDRKMHAHSTYFVMLRSALDSIAAVCDHNTTLVQVVAFSDPDWQLPRYLSVADDAGFQEHFLSMSDDSSSSERLWRTVPNRKWYAHQKGHTTGSQEVVLFHKLKS